MFFMQEQYTIDYTKYPLPRSRHHLSANQYLRRSEIHVPLSYYPPLLHECAWEDYFSNRHAPTYLDIGCGLGRFMLETSLQTPELNVLGLEVRKYAVDWIQNVVHSERPNGILHNAQAQWYNVANGLPFIATGSLQKIFYFFPDPWFKRRHFQRRAFTFDFLDECARILSREGTMYLMTDVPQVDEYQRTTLQKHGKFMLEECSNDAAWGLSARTNQEEFCLRKEIPYVRLHCRLK
jgi:tRNA (guanine-N7-)-methyltransferase